MAVRIAVQSFFMEMEYSGLGKDEHGIMLADLYKRRLGEVADLNIFNTMKGNAWI